MKNKKEISKQKQLESFSDNISVTLKLECCICMDTYEEDYEATGLPDEEVADEFLEDAYKEGWRESTSSVYGHIGIHCPVCHKNRNNPNHFE